MLAAQGVVERRDVAGLMTVAPQAGDRLMSVGIDSYVRAWEKPSDHVPVWADLDLETV